MIRPTTAQPRLPVRRRTGSTAMTAPSGYKRQPGPSPNPGPVAAASGQRRPPCKWICPGRCIPAAEAGAKSPMRRGDRGQYSLSYKSAASRLGRRLAGRRCCCGRHRVLCSGLLLSDSGWGSGGGSAVALPPNGRSSELEPGAGVHHRGLPAVDSADDLLRGDPFQVGTGGREVRVPELALDQR